MSEYDCSGLQHLSYVCGVCVRTIQALCQSWGGTTDTWLETEIAYHSGKESLERSLAQGCKVCKWIDRELGPTFLEPVQVFRSHRKTHLYINIHPLDLTGSNTISSRSYIRFAGTRNDVISQNDASNFPEYDIRHCQTWDISRLSHLKSRLSVARGWLQHCQKHHTLCARPLRRLEDVDWMPTRLVWCGIKPRVCMGNDILPNTPYLTLSHCWGRIPEQNRICLSKTNLEEWRKELPVLHQMKTFQDAIDVTRCLGFEYVWIDSLCIIQDSEEDWARESSFMADIYKYGVFNISATAAEDDRQGCYLPTKSDMPPYLRFKIPITENLPDGSAVTTDFVFHIEAGYGKSTNYVTQRGWILQERIMAPRILHFFQDQFLWECNEDTKWEDAAYGVSRLIHGPPFYPTNINKTDFFSAMENSFMRIESSASKNTSPYISRNDLNSEQNDLVILDSWLRLVECYSHTILTKPSDILVAISAIARYISSKIDSEYQAGIFEKFAVRQLCWWRELRPKRPTPPLRSDRYIAPSWSWASVPLSSGGIGMRYLIGNPGQREGPRPGLLGVELAQYKSCTTELRDSNPFGRVYGGRLELRARKKILVLCLPPSKEGLEPGATGINPQIDQKGRVNLTLPPKNIVSSICMDSHLPIRHSVLEGKECSSDGYICVPLYTDLLGRLLCLVLEPTNSGTYVRRGLLDIWFISLQEDGSDKYNSFSTRTLLPLLKELATVKLDKSGFIAKVLPHPQLEDVIIE